MLNEWLFFSFSYFRFRLIQVDGKLLAREYSCDKVKMIGGIYANYFNFSIERYGIPEIYFWGWQIGYLRSVQSGRSKLYNQQNSGKNVISFCVGV